MQEDQGGLMSTAAPSFGRRGPVVAEGWMGRDGTKLTSGCSRGYQSPEEDPCPPRQCLDITLRAVPVLPGTGDARPV